MPNFKDIRDRGLELSNSSLNVHDHLKSKTVEELQEISKSDRLPWHTVCLNLTGDLNVGTIIRTSHCFGAKSVIIFGRQRLDNRSLVGSSNYINIEKIPGLENNSIEYSRNEFIKMLEDRKLTPIFVETGGIELPKINWKATSDAINLDGKEICIIMGNETGGIPKNILSTVDFFKNSFIVSIPQYGVIRSLNVSVAHAVVTGDMCCKIGWM